MTIDEKAWRALRNNYTATNIYIYIALSMVNYRHMNIEANKPSTGAMLRLFGHHGQVADQSCGHISRQLPENLAALYQTTIQSSSPLVTCISLLPSTIGSAPSADQTSPLRGYRVDSTHSTLGGTSIYLKEKLLWSLRVQILVLEY